MSRWWSGRTGVERFDLSTRWPLYLLSASEPVLVLLFVLGQARVRAVGAAVLLVVTAAHHAHDDMDRDLVDVGGR